MRLREHFPLEEETIGARVSSMYNEMSEYYIKRSNSSKDWSLINEVYR